MAYDLNGLTPERVRDKVNHLKSCVAARDNPSSRHALDCASGEMTDGVPFLLALADSLAARCEELQRLSDYHEGGMGEVIDERDRAQDALQETHIALGGDGEWCGKVPSQPAPNSGDLHFDVPELAKQVLARCESAESR